MLTKQFAIVCTAFMALSTGQVTVNYASAEPAAPTTAPSDFVAHKSAVGKISIKSPADWKEGADIDEHLVMQLIADDSDSNVSIVMTNRPVTRKQNELLDMVTHLASGQVDNYKLKKTAYPKIAGMECVQIIFEGDAGNVHLTLEQTVIPARDHTFVITYTSHEHFDKYVQVVEQMLQSLELPR